MPVSSDTNHPRLPWWAYLAMDDWGLGCMHDFYALFGEDASSAETETSSVAEAAPREPRDTRFAADGLGFGWLARAARFLVRPVRGNRSPSRPVPEDQIAGALPASRL